MQVDKLVIETESIAEMVRGGDYYAQAREWYADIHYGPMIQRSLILIVTALATAGFLVALLALSDVLPLTRQVVFPVRAGDITNDVVTLRHLSRPGDPVNPAMMKFLLSTYVRQRESYNADRLAANINGVKSFSAADVFAEYRNYMSPENPVSPISQYERHSIRDVDIRLVRVLPRAVDAPQAEDVLRAEIVFDAAVRNAQEVKTVRKRANIAFRYGDLTVNQQSGEVGAMRFQVTEYKVTDYEK